MDKTIKIIIADDHPIFMNGLKQILAEDEGIEIIGSAVNGEKALQLIIEQTPDVAILDIDMPKLTGMEVIKNLDLSKIKTKIIFLTVFASEDVFDKAMELGISGYVLKDCAVNDIVACIYKVNENNYYISPSISNFMVSRHDRIKKFENDNPATSNLTKTEVTILKMIAEGKTSKDIAEILFISYKTVENHRSNMSNKLNLKGSLSLVKFAIKNNPLL